MTEQGLALADYMPVMGNKQALQRYQSFKEFVEGVLKKGVDYGVIPGASKPSLQKPGAEKLATFFGLAPVFEDVVAVEDWTGEAHGGEAMFYYRQKCKLYRNDRLVGSADGSCNSREKKYRWRESQRKCPTCGKATIIKGKVEFGGGWLCFKKQGGCGAKFAETDPTVITQLVGRVPNEDIADQVNTILKMAQKRALVAAVLIATNASEYFTQDIEDYIEGTFTESPAPPQQADAPHEQPATTTETAPLEPPVCPLHFVPMSRETSKKTGKLSAWFHRDSNGKVCTGEAKPEPASAGK